MALLAFVAARGIDTAHEERATIVTNNAIDSYVESVTTRAPPHFPPVASHPENPTTIAGVALGQRLFHDARLSRTRSVSCGTCHEARHAFTIPEALPTRGVTGRPLARNPPVLLNLAWAETGLFWDGGSKNLESLALAPITHTDEMGREGDLEGMMAELAADAEYPRLFAAAFVDHAVTVGNLMRALAQFVRSIVSARSRWDDLQTGAAAWTADERRGEDVFRRDCAGCHIPPLFTDGGYHSNGLDASFGDDPEAPRRGRGRITFAARDIGKYRTPTLRDVAVSGPYMHDGRLTSLEAVIVHYRSGMVETPSLDVRFRRPGRRPGVTMSDEEARGLLVFLSLLTDRELVAEAAGR